MTAEKKGYETKALGYRIDASITNGDATERPLDHTGYPVLNTVVTKIEEE